MKNVLRNVLIIEATIVSVCMWSIPSAAKGQNNILTLLRKIQVDHQGTAGACDGSAFNTKGDIIAASDNTGLTKLFSVEDGVLVSVIKHNEREVSAKDGETNVIQQDGNEPVVIEAEDFDANVAQGSHWWSVIDDETASGGKKVQALPDGTGAGHGMDVNFQTGDPTKDSPKLDYRVNITRPGTYYVWTRAQGVDHYANSYHIGLNGHPVNTADRMENLSDEYEWIWSRDTKDQEPATLEIPNAGPVTLNLWMREDGIEVDKIILTTQKVYVPQGQGPEPNDRYHGIRQPEKGPD